MKFKSVQCPVVIAATHVRELNIIQQTDTGLRVGASVTLTTLNQALKQAMQQFDGNVQKRLSLKINVNQSVE